VELTNLPAIQTSTLELDFLTCGFPNNLQFAFYRPNNPLNYLLSYEIDSPHPFIQLAFGQNNLFVPQFRRAHQQSWVVNFPR